MGIKFGLIQAKLQLSLRSIWSVISQPLYAVLAVTLGFIFFEVVYWAFNMNILSLVLVSGLSIVEKAVFMLSPFQDIFSTTSGLVGTLMISVAAVQGVNLALLVYTIKHRRRLNAGVIGGGSIAGLLDVFGLGCSACGTSLLVPIVAIFASSSAVAISEKLTVIAPLLAVIIGLIGVYYLGIQVANIGARLKQTNQDIGDK